MTEQDIKNIITKLELDYQTQLKIVNFIGKKIHEYKSLIPDEYQVLGDDEIIEKHHYYRNVYQEFVLVHKDWLGKTPGQLNTGPNKLFKKTVTT